MTSFAVSVAPLLLTPATMIGELVAARPVLARLLEKLGIDYCCGGKQTLAVACSRRGLEVATTITLLECTGDPSSKKCRPLKSLPRE